MFNDEEENTMKIFEKKCRNQCGLLKMKANDIEMILLIVVISKKSIYCQ